MLTAALAAVLWGLAVWLRWAAAGLGLLWMAGAGWRRGALWCWLLGSRFSTYITNFDHWIAFLLLAFVGGKMIFDAVKEMRHPEEQLSEKRFSMLEVTVQGVATSIDALAVGIGMIAMYGDGVTEVTIWGYTAIIGVTTFILSVVGIFLGTRVGKLFQRKTSLARVFGGLILVGIGLKILIEGLL